MKENRPRKNARPMVVALTGGIGSGKTATSDHFKSLGVEIIDTDIMARKLTEPETKILNQIQFAFGNDIVDEMGHLRRRKLRKIIFNDPVSRRKLENILHPAIHALVKKKLSRVATSYCIVVIPLLAETGVPDYIDRILVIDVNETVQLRRLMARDSTSQKQAEAALNSQASRSERLSLADDVIVNDEGLDKLHRRVESLHNFYRSLTDNSG